MKIVFDQLLFLSLQCLAPKTPEKYSPILHSQTSFVLFFCYKSYLHIPRLINIAAHPHTNGVKIPFTIFHFIYS